MQKYFHIEGVRIFLILIFILLINSCAKSNNKDYKVYEIGQEEWKSNSINKFAGNINYSATEVPIRYFILKNTNNSHAVDSIYENSKTERIIEFDFQHTQSKDLLKRDFTNLSYESGVKYLSFKISDDFKVVTSANDTINCSGVNFERTFNITPYKRALLYFKGISPKENITLLYKDKLFGNGFFKFNINEIPIKL